MTPIREYKYILTLYAFPCVADNVERLLDIIMIKMSAGFEYAEDYNM